MRIHILPALEDNYIYILQSQDQVCVIDPGDATPVLRFLQENRLRLSIILNTHSHPDHTDGNQVLHEHFHCPILSFGNYPSGTYRRLHPGERVAFGDTAFEVLATPGHTSDSACFYFPGQPGMLFTGDTLFGAGCGRVFADSVVHLWDSLHRLALLPEDTQVYFGHEYTLANLTFALRVAPNNPAIRERKIEEEKHIHAHLPTVPSTVGLEKKTNVFLLAPNSADFTKLRHEKDVF